MIETVISTELPINERLAIKKNIIKGSRGDKRIAIVTGTHGDELEGQMVCYEMARRLNESIGSLDGQVEIWPALNPLGIDTIQRGIPNFDLDMNRIFPGNKEGSVATMAQNLNSAYFLDDFKYRHSMNPAYGTRSISGTISINEIGKFSL